MSSFQRPVQTLITTKIDATERTAAASTDVFCRLRNGVHTIEITALNDVIYFGNDTVTTENGRPIPAGTTVTIPVDTTSNSLIYVVGGDCIVTEYF